MKRTPSVSPRHIAAPNDPGSGYAVRGLVAGSGAWELLSVSRADDAAAPLLLKRLKPLASADDAVGLRNEWEIVSHYRLGCMLEPVDFLGHGPDSAILYRDPEACVGGPHDEAGILASADAIALALGEVHAAGIILGDLQPAHLLFTPQRAYLIDFSRARPTPRVQQDIDSVWTLRRNLNYIAPEQTGRLNRTADYRADYYSFGVILYHWLTGQLPFAAAHPLELVYAHLTREPVRPDQLQPGLSPFLSGIAMKLLAKDPDHRYQSIEGLRADLEIARGRAHPGAETPIGAYDVPYHFAVTHKLYGRDAERAALLHSYDRACRGEREMILIAGYSGVGKTSLIRETYIPVTRQKAFFVAGKFDQLQRTRPYSAWIEALRKLMTQVLAEPAESLARWRQQLAAVLGANGSVLAQMVPELEALLGPLEPPPELPPAEALHRFNETFRRFLGCFCQPEQPLAVFLDDLQWIDGASLNLLELLLRDTERRYLFPIGAYRDNEVYPGHPLLLVLDRLKRDRVCALTELTLQPLDDAAVGQLVADTFALPVPEARPLAGVLARKTGGNPFFLWQMLQALRTRGDVRFDSAVLRWTWDMAAIEQLAYTDNVLDLMRARFQDLPDETRGALALAACLGSQFELATLSVLCGCPPHAVFRHLQPARDAEFIVPAAPLEVRAAHLVIGRFRFLHDRLQEAAYRSIPTERIAATHHRIARLLMREAGTEDSEERIFQIADHLNRAIPLLAGREDGLQLARVNLAAAGKARAAAAYDAALRYADFGMARLPENLWDTERDLARALFRCRGDLEYLNGHFEPAEAFIRAAIAHEADRLQRADLIHMLVVQYTLRALYPKAIDTAREGLRLLGVELPQGDYERACEQELERIQRQLGGRGLAALAELPAMDDPEQRMVMTLLTALGPPCYRSDPGLWSVIVAREVALCLEYGSVATASYTLPAFGGLLVHVGCGSGRDCAELYRITGQLMLRFGQAAETSVGHLMMGSSLTHWFAPLTEATRDYLRAYQIGLDSGNLQYAVYAFGHNTYCRFYQGTPLAELIAEAEAYLEFCRKRGNRWGIDLVEGALRVFSTLHGAGGQPDFGWQDEPESAYLDRIASQLQVSCIYHVLKSEALWHLGRLPEAAASLSEAMHRLDSVSVQGLLPASQIQLVRALLLAQAPELLGAAEPDARRELATIRARFERWAEGSPATFSHAGQLLRAEEARLDGDIAGVLDAYDRALAAARDHGFQQRAAMIAVRAALFWTERGKRAFAEVYQRQAEFAYQAWQAGHVLGQTAGNRFWSVLTGADDNGGLPWSASARELDQQALLGAAQALSQPMSLAGLVQAIMRAAAQCSGAQRIVLVLPSDTGLRVTADTAAAELPAPGLVLDEEENLPRAVLNYVARSGSLWRLTSAGRGTDTLYLQDDYFRRKNPSSALCLPLLYLHELGGLLYVEHFELGDAFDAHHTAALEFSAGLAAIAIRNARLFEALQQEIGARQRVEQALQCAQEVAHLGSWTLDARTRRVTATPELLKLLGLPPEVPLSPEQYREQIHPDDRAGVELAWERAIASRGGLELEYRISADGSTRWVQENVRLAFDPEGELTEGLGTVLDVTSRKQREAEYRAVIETTTDGFIRLDADMRILEVNDAYIRLSGYARDELLQMRVAELEASDSAEGVAHHGVTLIQQGHDCFETRHRKKNGATWPVEFSATYYPAYGGAGSEDRYFCFVRDITERKRAETALSASRNLLRTVIDTAPVRVFWKDRDLRYLGCNPAFVRDADKQHPDELIGQEDYQQPWRDQAERYRADDRAVIESGTAKLAIEEPQTTPDGRQMWLRTSKVPLKTPDDEIIGVLGVYEDITEQKQAEEQLREAKRAAEAANLAKSRFLAMMSHEIRTPMTAVLGLNQLALQTALTVQQRDYLQKIDGAARGLLGIVNDILDVSKIEAGQLTLETRAFRLRELVDELASQMRVESAAKGLAFRVVCPEELSAPLQGDPLRLRQVLMNLLSNAIKFTPSGEVVLEIELIDQAGACRRLRFEVRDTGIGIPEQEQANLFEAFRQVDSSITRRYGGTGLGLTICKQLVTLMAGDISVCSAPGRGSTFRVDLWFEPVSDPRTELPTDERTAQVAVADLTGCRVLVAEDNPLSRQVAAELLQRLGVDVQLAHDGREAVRKVARQRFDAVLMDIHMPELDGFAATRQIRALPARQDLPIIALTADAFSDDRRRCLAHGMNDHVAKPFDIRRLAAVLARWIDASRQKSSGGVPPLAVSTVDVSPTGVPRGGETPPVSGSAGAVDDREPGDTVPPCIDVAGAMGRLGGDRALYERCVRNYLALHAATPQRARALFAAGDHGGLRALAHRLKGEAGTVGAVAVAETARAIDQGVRTQCLDDLETQVERLASVMLASAAQLVAQLATETAVRPASPSPAPLAGNLPAVLKALNEHLRHNNLKAREDLQALAALLTEPGDRPVLERLRRLIGGLAFAEALEVLRAEAAGRDWHLFD